MARQTVRHPGEGWDPANASLDSGLRRKDDRGEGIPHILAGVKIFTRQYTSTTLLERDLSLPFDVDVTLCRLSSYSRWERCDDNSQSWNCPVERLG